ncbi:hypothetical protein IGI04_003533, partial [Brassica rapa subsp. trilocularis]
VIRFRLRPIASNRIDRTIRLCDRKRLIGVQVEDLASSRILICRSKISPPLGFLFADEQSSISLYANLVMILDAISAVLFTSLLLRFLIVEDLCKPKMSINLQTNSSDYVEDFPELAEILQRSRTEWLRSADIDEILRSRPSISLMPPALHATGLFLCDQNAAASDEHLREWETTRLMTTKETVPLYYKSCTLPLNENSVYEKRIYRPYQDLHGAVFVHLRIIDLPQEATSGEDTDHSTASVDYRDVAGHESGGEGDPFSSLNANDGGVKSENDTERKGVDMVLPDASLLSKEIGDSRLAKILSRGGSCEDVVEAIHDELTKIKEEMRNGQVALEKYVITKALTKSIEAYPDSKSQPHVQVALRMRQRGYEEGFNAEDTVPYIICFEQGNTGSASSAGIAERARHPDEVKEDDSRWLVDIDYYLAQQIHPVVSRLCAEIEGTSPERLAECLGLDPSKYGSRSNDARDSDPYTLLGTSDEERYEGCEPLALTCPSCSAVFNCPSITSSVCALISKNTQTEESDSTFWLNPRCPKCERGRLTAAMIANQVKRQLDGFVGKFYKNIMMCDDCQHRTRIPSFHVVDGRERGTVCPTYPRCNGTLVRKYTAADWYNQVSYFCYILDTRSRTLEKKKQMDAGVRVQVDGALAKIEPVAEKAEAIARGFRDRSEFGYLNLQDIAAEGIAVRRTFASLKNYQVNGNKEMMAIRFMNMAGSCTSCYVTTVLATLLFLMPLFYYTPDLILAAIIFSTSL